MAYLQIGALKKELAEGCVDASRQAKLDLMYEELITQLIVNFDRVAANGNSTVRERRKQQVPFYLHCLRLLAVLCLLYIPHYCVPRQSPIYASNVRGPLYVCPILHPLSVVVHQLQQYYVPLN
jgi:hypothetical protein